jgi:hypothetical protein
VAVAFSASSESHTGTTGSASEASFSWTHPGGSAQAAVVFVFSIAASDNGSSVDYGGTSMAAVSGGSASDTLTEPGTVKAYFLDACGTGDQTVTVTRTNNATVMYAVAITLTAEQTCEVYESGIVLLEENGTFAEQNVDDGSNGIDSLRCAASYYGGAAPAPAGANSTLLQSIDLGAFGCSVVRETTAGQGSRLVGFTQATADDRAAVHFAVREVIPVGASPVLNQSAFGLRYDVGSASDAPWIAAENTAIIRFDIGHTFRLRIEIEETNNSPVTDSFKLQCDIDGGGWQDVTADSFGVQIREATLVDDDKLTQDWLTTSPRQFVPGHFDEDGSMSTVTLQNQCTECSWCIRMLKSELGPDQSILFRAVRSDGTPLDSYAALPHIITTDSQYLSL